MLQSYENFMYKVFDSKVEAFLRQHLSDEILTQHGPRRSGIAKSVQEIAIGTKLSAKGVSACLIRLKRKNLVEADGEGWKIKCQ